MIEEEHKAQKEFVEKHKIVVGKQVKYKRHGEIINSVITFVNKHWYWFGDKHGQINRKDVLYE